MRGRKTGEWEGDGLSRIGGKEESGADAGIDLAAWTECRIKNPTSGREDERRMGKKNLKTWKKRGKQCCSSVAH